MRCIFYAMFLRVLRTFMYIWQVQMKIIISLHFDVIFQYQSFIEILNTYFGDRACRWADNALGAKCLRVTNVAGWCGYFCCTDCMQAVSSACSWVLGTSLMNVHVLPHIPVLGEKLVIWAVTCLTRMCPEMRLCGFQVTDQIFCFC
jgi:hypothetical protein